jgi:outer membrane protein OmpA-like peptidoglycan-associated protein
MTTAKSTLALSSMQQKSNIQKKLLTIDNDEIQVSPIENKNDEIQVSPVEKEKETEKQLFPGTFPLNAFCYTTFDQQKLSVIEQSLVSCQDTIYVYGHSCPLGNDDYKQRISQNRADCVKRLLMKNDALTNKTIIAKGLSDSVPFESATGNVSHSEDRRVTIECR